MKDKLNVLRSLAGGPTDPMPNMGELISQNQITDNKIFLSETVGEETFDRWNHWNSDIADEWDFTPDTNEEYWSTFKKLYPGSEEDATGFMRKEVLDSFQGKPPEEQEMIFRDKFRTWPVEMYDELENHFIQLKGLNDSKQIERSTILHRLELGKILENTNYALDPQVPATQHSRDWLRLYRDGHGSDIKTNENGRLGVGVDGSFKPAFTMGDNQDTMEAEEQLIYHKYLKPLVDTEMKLAVDYNRNTLREEEEDIQFMLSKEIDNPLILDEHKINIIIDVAMGTTNPLQETLGLLDKMVESRMNSKGFLNDKDLVRFYAKQVKNIQSNVEGRLGNG